jgi:Zn-dependent protease
MISGWHIGSLFGIPLRLNPTWFLSLLLFAFFFTDRQPGGWESSWSWIAGLGMALLLFASVLLHELGHSLVAQSHGLTVNAITLFPFGGIASIAQESKTPKQAFWVAIAGPAVSFVLFMLLSLLSLILPSPLKLMLSSLADLNLVLALFNLIPGLPLDGGQVLKAALWKATGSRIKAVRWAARVGQLLGWAAIGLGIAGFLGSLRFSFLWLVLLGWFGIRRASAYQREIALQTAMLHLSAADAMRQDVRVIEADTSLQDFVLTHVSTDLDPTHSDTEVYYAETSGRWGIVAVEKLRLIERSQWSQQPIHTLVEPLEPLAVIPATVSLAEVIDRLETQRLSWLAVLSPAGAVIGMIDRADVVQAVAHQLHLQVPEAVMQQIKADCQFPPNLQLHNTARDALK